MGLSAAGAIGAVRLLVQRERGPAGLPPSWQLLGTFKAQLAQRHGPAFESPKADPRSRGTDRRRQRFR